MSFLIVIGGIRFSHLPVGAAAPENLHDEINFTAWPYADSLPTSAGNYRLTSDVTISSRWDVPSGTTNLCLNGYAIIRTNASDTTGSVIQVGSGATLNLYDCGTETRYYTVSNPTVNGAGLGTVVEKSVYDAASENARGTFTGGYITGGVISGAADANHLIGGGVNVAGGAFHMYGGTIIGNKVCINGGGVKVKGAGASFIMDGGAILANYNDCYGGGISVGDNGGNRLCTLSINGGTIARNWSGRNGGAIHLDSYNHNFTITGGSIVNNYTNGNYDNGSIGRAGGGIIKDGTPLVISGNPVIKDNMNGGNQPNNAYMRSDKTDVITLSGLTDGSDVSVYIKGITASNDIKIATGAQKTDIQYLHYDIPNEAGILYCDGETDWICCDGETVELVGAHHTHEAGTVWASTAANPAARVTASEAVTAYSDWNAALNAWTDGATLTLMKDVTVASAVSVSGTKTMDLNGCGITLTGGGTTVIKVNNGAAFTLEDSGDTTHYFTAPENDYGKATNISNTDSGSQSSFTGGYITGGTAKAYETGGGVHVGNNASFVMKGGTIIGNGSNEQENTRGAGVVIYYNSTFLMEGGAIMYNLVYNEGGGVFLKDTARMEMTGGVISHNYAKNGSGGVHIGGGSATFLMSGGEIAYNRAGTTGGEGGGMCAYTGKLTMTGGSIHHNAVGTNGQGGGVLYKENGNLTVSGSASIIDNTAGDATQNIYINNKIIHLAGALTGTKQFGVSFHAPLLTNIPITFTSDWNTYMENIDPEAYITSDNASYDVFLSESGEAEIGIPPAASVTVGETVNKYAAISDAINAWKNGGTLTLLKDATFNEIINMRPMYGYGASEYVLDLNGNTFHIKSIQVGLNNSPNTLRTGPHLTIQDSGTGGILHFSESGMIDYGGLVELRGGTLTGGNGTWGGLFLLHIYASLDMYDGVTLTGNTSTYGGAVLVGSDSVFNMYGGKITGNSASDSGGGVVIFDNDAAKFNLYGGEISGNRAPKGGGVSVNVGQFSICGSEAVIRDNVSGGSLNNETGTYTGGASSNVYLPSGKTIKVTAALSSTPVGVTLQNGEGVITSGLSDYGTEENFISDNADFEVRLENGEAILAYPFVSGVSAEGFTGDYDGEAHNISVTVPEGATVKYGTSAGNFTLSDAPSYTNAGTYTVYYQVSQSKRTGVTGYATVEITPLNITVTVTGHKTTVDYNGNAHSADGYDAAASSALYDVTKDFTYGGRAEAVRTNVGTTAMGLRSERFTNLNGNFNVVTFAVTDGYIEILPVDAVITTAPVSEKPIYNGSKLNLIVPGKSYGGTLYYALGDDPRNAPADDSFNTAIPKAKELGSYYVWYKVVADRNHNDLSPTYVKVVIAEESWVTLSGVLYENDGKTPLGDSVVTLTKGNQQIDYVITDSNGNYEFIVPAGTYNIVANGHGVSATGMVKIFDNTSQDFVMSGGKTESIIKVNGDSNFGITAGGLNEEAYSIRKSGNIDSDTNVSVLMTVRSKADNTAANTAAFSTLMRRKSFMFFDVKLEATVGSDITVLKTSNNVLEIAVPYTKVNRRGLSVYYSDGSGVKSFKESDSKENGTYSIDKENGFIYIYSNQFSTFAIGYTPYYHVKSTVSLGSFRGNATVILDGRNGEGNFELKDIDLSKISFADIPKGEYKMSVTWKDGATNTLTMPITVS